MEKEVSKYCLVQPFENCIHPNYTYKFISYAMENTIHLHYATNLLMLFGKIIFIMIISYNTSYSSVFFVLR